MKILKSCTGDDVQSLVSKCILTTMKVMIYLMAFMSFQLQAATSFGQRVNIVNKKASLADVFQEIKEQTHLHVLCDAHILREHTSVSVSQRNQPLTAALNAILSPLDLGYEIKGSSILVYRSKQKTIPNKTVAVVQRDRQVTGMVRDTMGTPLVGVSVILQSDKKISTQTDQNGRFVLEIPIGDQVLEVRNVGYLTKTVNVNAGSSMLDITLQRDENGLEEVVVVGFGTQKKISVVGAVETIKPELLKTTSSSFTTSFAGKVAGMYAVQKSGEPGNDGANFWIRGLSSFAGNTSPLIILDGVEVDATILNAIPPEVVEQFSVLKDATATALYGTRGANGVLIITTKTGKNMERMNINVRVEGGLAAPTKEVEMADAVTYMTMYNEAYRARATGTYVPKFSDEKIDGTRQKLDPYIFPDVDWTEVLFKKQTYNQNVNLNVTGGSSKVNYFINGSYFNENGLFKTLEERYDNNIIHQRYNLQSNVTANVTPTTTIGVRVNAIFRDLQRPQASTSTIYTLTQQIPPSAFPVFFPAKNGEDYTLFGNAAGPYGVGYYPNPYAELVKGKTDEFNTTTLGVFDVNQKLDFLLEGLSLKSLVSFNNYSTTYVTRAFKPYYFTIDKYMQTPVGNYDYSLTPIGEPGQTALSTASSSNGYRRFHLQGAIDYTHTFGEKHAVNAMLLYHQKQYNNNQPSNDLLTALPQREQGLAGRFTYGYNSTYLTEFNFGYNGSENFKKGNRFGFFPSIAVGYVISNEKYFQTLTPVIHLLKLRGSYGLVGNDKINARFPYITNVNLNAQSQTFGYDYNNTLSGPKVTLIGNENAQWEVGRKANIGLEVGLFNHFNLIADVFREDRDKIFMQRRTIPSFLGMGSILPYANIGKMKNQGLDMTLEYNRRINADWQIGGRGTFTFATNELVDRDEPAQQEPYQSEIGHPLNLHRGLIADGLFTSEDEIANWAKSTFEPIVLPGDIRYKDLNNDGVIDDNDRMALGHPSTPEIIYGFGLSVNYKKVGLSFNFQGVGRTSIMVGAAGLPFGKNEFNVPQFIADNYWQLDNPNPNAEYPRLDPEENLHNNRNSTFWLRDGSFLRLKDVELSYGFKYFRAYLAGNNVLLFSKFKHWDPEIGWGAGLAYPPQRTFRVGLQFNFN